MGRVVREPKMRIRHLVETGIIHTNLDRIQKEFRIRVITDVRVPKRFEEFCRAEDSGVDLISVCPDIFCHLDPNSDPELT